MKDGSLPAALVFVALVVGGIVALFLKQETLGASMIGVALGQLGPSPVPAKAGKR